MRNDLSANKNHPAVFERLMHGSCPLEKANEHSRTDVSITGQNVLASAYKSHFSINPRPSNISLSSRSTAGSHKLQTQVAQVNVVIRENCNSSPAELGVTNCMKPDHGSNQPANYSTT